jgi:hypothetical protein
MEKSLRQLINSWVEMQKQSIALGAAIHDLREETGIRLTYSRLAEWRRGKYTPSQKVLSQMLYDVLPWAFQRAGITVTREQQAALDSLLWNTRGSAGEQQIELL